MMVRIHGGIIVVEEASGTKNFYKDDKGLRDVLLRRFPELQRHR